MTIDYCAFLPTTVFIERTFSTFLLEMRTYQIRYSKKDRFMAIEYLCRKLYKIYQSYIFQFQIRSMKWPVQCIKIVYGKFHRYAYILSWRCTFLIKFYHILLTEEAHIFIHVHVILYRHYHFPIKSIYGYE